MSVIGSNILAGASGQGGDYTIARSLRFRSSATASLSRTPSSASNRKTWTWSDWIKRGNFDAQTIFEAATDGNNTTICYLDSSNRIVFVNSVSGSANISLTTSQVFRDPSAWYHIVVAVDTTQATNTNRVKLYVNGTQITAFSSATYPSQNADTFVNNNIAHSIGKRSFDNSLLYDGYHAEINFIDGQALTPSSFGATNASTGVWQPKKYAGTYGTNGFYLPFTDNSALTTSSNAGLGKDFSGNGNYWTTNNISITSGSTYDSMTDVPTLTSATASNFAVMNPLVSPLSGSTYTFSNANLTTLVSVQTAYPAASVPTMSFQTSGKWYCEVTLSAQGAANTWKIGITSNPRSSGSSAFGDVSADYAWQINGNFSPTNPTFYNNGSPLGAYGSTITTNDTLMVAYDVTSGKFWLGKNGTWFSSGDPSAGTNAGLTGLSGEYWLGLSTGGTTNSTNTYQLNFGQRPFAYTPPTGFVALNTFNLPTPTIGATASTQANKYFAPALYTADTAGGKTIDVGFQPDLVWIKNRDNVEQHYLADAVRGGGTSKYLRSNSTNAEGGAISGDCSIAFTSNGFSLTDADYTTGEIYFNGRTYVSWNWKANGSGSTNTAGSITSTVSANTSAGFSVVTYTGNGSAGATVGHGIGVAPRMLIIKARDGAGYSWKVYHGSLGSGSHLELESSGGSQGGIWNSTNPSSTVFTLGTNAGINENGKSYIAYVFAEVTGYSKISSFTGNGNADGTFVYTGFRPKYILTKSTSAARFWFVTDTSRDTYNVCNLPLFPNDSQGETAGTTDFDILSNGFKARTTNAAVNGNGETIIYMAFAENPFKYSLAR